MMEYTLSYLRVFFEIHIGYKGVMKNLSLKVT